MSEIDDTLNLVDKAAGFDKDHSGFVKNTNYRSKLIDIRKELRKLKFATDENCSVAVFGESQVGKSYLVTALLSEPNTPFCVKNGDESYNFKDEINPSERGSQIEATGVVTRFTARNASMPEGYLRVQLLSLADLILIMAEAYYNQVDRNMRDATETMYSIQSILDSVTTTAENKKPLLDEVDVANVEEYLRKMRGNNLDTLFSTNYFRFLMSNVRALSEGDIVSLIKMLWNDNADFNDLFDELLAIYRKVDFADELYVEFGAVLKKNGTLLDVALLDDLRSNRQYTPESFNPEANVKLKSGSTLSIAKKYLSALTAEISIPIDTSKVGDRKFLNDLDILDFPGLKPDNVRKENELKVGKNLTTVYRRGKVTYLFNKYSSSKRISALLFCHNNNDSKACTNGPVLKEWVNSNIAATPEERGIFVGKTGISPLFIVNTWFNKDLEYQNETPDSDLDNRWQRRFKLVLYKDVLQAEGYSDHWFNKWTESQAGFQNMYMLRDFDYSRQIFDGYDPNSRTPETELHIYASYPDFMDRLKESFVNNDFVKEHFADPIKAWQDSATAGNDGTKAIINGLNVLSPNVKAARTEKFGKDHKNLKSQLEILLKQEYHSDDHHERVKKARKDAATIRREIRKSGEQNPFLWGKLIDELMIPSSKIYNCIFEIVHAGTDRRTGREEDLFNKAGLATEESREYNIDRLKIELLVDTEQEVMDELENEGIDFDRLLGIKQMAPTMAQKMVERFEQLWKNDFMASVSAKTRDQFQCIDLLQYYLFALYDTLEMNNVLANEIVCFIGQISEDSLPGVISECLAEKINSFVESFGYNGFISEESKENIQAQNLDYKLNLEFNLVDDLPSLGVNETIRLLEKYENRLPATDAEHQERDRLPEIHNEKKWNQRMIAAFIISCDLPRYDINANAELGELLNEFEKIIE